MPELKRSAIKLFLSCPFFNLIKDFRGYDSSDEFDTLHELICKTEKQTDSMKKRKLLLLSSSSTASEDTQTFFLERWPMTIKVKVLLQSSPENAKKALYLKKKIPCVVVPYLSQSCYRKKCYTLNRKRLSLLLENELMNVVLRLLDLFFIDECRLMPNIEAMGTNLKSNGMKKADGGLVLDHTFTVLQYEAKSCTTSVKALQEDFEKMMISATTHLSLLKDEYEEPKVILVQISGLCLNLYLVNLFLEDPIYRCIHFQQCFLPDHRSDACRLLDLYKGLKKAKANCDRGSNEVLLKERRMTVVLCLKINKS
ncbi:hypothetical protein BD560DRAFT_426424 [Blakeslea trispora]|nr:hypothetical protein BD560DRAFT_426424 [Blakeslea trispora]